MAEVKYCMTDRQALASAITKYNVTDSKVIKIAERYVATPRPKRHEYVNMLLEKRSKIEKN